MEIPIKPESPSSVGAANESAAKPTRRWRAWFFQAYWITATLAFGVLFVWAGQFDYLPVDLSITHKVQAIHAAGFSVLMEAVSFIGYAPQAWLLVGIVSWGYFLAACVGKPL